MLLRSLKIIQQLSALHCNLDGWRNVLPWKLNIQYTNPLGAYTCVSFLGIFLYHIMDFCCLKRCNQNI